MNRVLNLKSIQVFVCFSILAACGSAPSDARIVASAPSAAMGEIEILSWSWGETNESAVGGGIFNDIVLVMPTSVPSVKLFREFCNGTSHPQFSIRTIVGEDPFGAGEQKVLEITLTDVIISSYQTGGSSGGDIPPTDTLSLNFGSIKFEYRELMGDGSVRFISESIPLVNPARQTK